MKRFILVSYCSHKDIDYLKSFYTKDDFIVAIDQGTKLLIENDIIPDLIVGDFDSFNPKDITFPTIYTSGKISFKRDGLTKIIKLNQDKDETDLEFAIKEIIKQKIDNYEIIIINDLQGRTDHSLAVLGLLQLQFKKDKKILMSIRNNNQEIFLSKGSFKRDVVINQTVSLIPISAKVKNIYTQGLLYRLENQTLFRKNSKGVSNKTLDKKIEINFSAGELLIVINRGILYGFYEDR